MPVPVRLDFNPPSVPNIVKLYIYEALAADGTGEALIETVVPPNLGTYPEYISRYTTALANSNNNWFSIDWEDDKGAKLGQSERVQGGTNLLINQVVNRVMLLDPTLNENAVTFEVEAIISDVFNTQEPYDPDLVATYGQMRGMTYLAMARSLIVESIKATETESVTLGLVSMKGSTSRDVAKDVERLIDLANSDLGILTSVVMQLEAVQYGLGSKGIEYDQSRLMMWYEIQ
jgi:hypothetical protein